VPQRSGCVLRNCTPGPGHPSGRYQADMREAKVFARTISANRVPEFNPNDTIMLSAGATF